MSGRRLPPPPHRQLNASWEVSKGLGGLWDTLEVLGPSHTEPLKVVKRVRECIWPVGFDSSYVPLGA